MNQTQNNTLGQHVQQLLVAHNLENPVLANYIKQWQNPQHFKLLESKLAEFLHLLGFNLEDCSLNQTPNRVVKFFMEELFYGLNYANFPCVSATPNDFKYTSPLVSQGISVNSTCEHHLVAIQGKAVVAYIPTDTIVGLSKINQIVDFFAKRPQVQERMTRQIFVVLQDILATSDVAVAINAVHDCIVLRGTKDTDSEILTIETGGRFENDPVLKASFFQQATNMSAR